MVTPPAVLPRLFMVVNFRVTILVLSVVEKLYFACTSSPGLGLFNGASVLSTLKPWPSEFKIFATSTSKGSFKSTGIYSCTGTSLCPHVSINIAVEGVCAPARELGLEIHPVDPSLKLDGGALGRGGLDDVLRPDDPPEKDAFNGLARSVPISGVCDLMARLPNNDSLPVGLSGVT